MTHAANLLLGLWRRLRRIPPPSCTVPVPPDGIVDAFRRFGLTADGKERDPALPPAEHRTLPGWYAHRAKVAREDWLTLGPRFYVTAIYRPMRIPAKRKGR